MAAGLLVTALGYLVGSIPFGYLVVRWRTGGDIRVLGTGSSGARNVARQLGWGWGALSGILDVVKGAAATGIAATAAPGWAVPAAAAAVAGHNWPVTLGFRGGRGIAPAFGATLVADPLAAGVSLAAVGIVTATTRRSMAGYAAGLAAAPLTVIAAGRPPQTVAVVGAVVAIALVGHLPLLARLRPLGAGR